MIRWLSYRFNNSTLRYEVVCPHCDVMVAFITAELVRRSGCLVPLMEKHECSEEN